MKTKQFKHSTFTTLKMQLCKAAIVFRYKFFFSLENSMCKDYISEKFWHKAISNHVVPVVMGPSREDYELVAPPNSFIHVDDFSSIEDLANYLIKLNNNDELYKEYITWMSIPENRDIFHGTNEKKLKDSAKPNGLCALCEKLKLLLLEKETKSEVVTKLDEWWFGKGYSQYNEKFTICSKKSGPSGDPKRWKITAGYSFCFLMLWLLWKTSYCKSFKNYSFIKIINYSTVK